MKTLILLRHAKSSWDDPDLDDFERPLAKRGRKAAGLAGGFMAERGWVPGLALVSPARRARETWERVAAALPGRVETRFEEALYMAGPDDILALLRDAAGLPGAVLVIGHNPGLEECARRLAGPASDPDALARLTEKFPTAALARFEAATLEPGGAALTDFVRPKDIGGR